MHFIFVDENGPTVRPMEASTPDEQVAQHTRKVCFINKIEAEDYISFFLSSEARPAWFELTNSGFHMTHESSPAWLFGHGDGWTETEAEKFLTNMNLGCVCLTTNETLEW